MKPQQSSNFTLFHTVPCHVLLLFLSLVTALPLAAVDWPQWRGPDRSNVSEESGLLQEWPTNGPPLLWELTGLGNGIAAVAVAAGRAYTLGYLEDGEYLFALDAASGECLWTSLVGPAKDPKHQYANSLMRWLSPRVPTVDDDRVYTISATGELNCLNTRDGRVLWSKSYPADFASEKRVWGFCDYPLVDGEKLICVPAGPDATVVALHKRTGGVLWKSLVPGEKQGSHAATIISMAAGVRQYLCFVRLGLVSVAANDGRLLWQYEKTKGRYASSYTPIACGDLVFSANGYGGGMALLKIVAEKDVLRAVEQYYARDSYYPFSDNTLLAGEHIYTVFGPGALVCFPLHTGIQQWCHRPATQRRTAMTLADHRLYVRRSDGTVTLVEASPAAYVERGSFTIPNPEEVSGVTFPVVANGRLYLRDNNRLLCYDVRSIALAKTRDHPKKLAVPVPTSPAFATARTQGEYAVPPKVPDAIFVPTPHDIVDQMLASVSLTNTSILYDLGSGDGRILIAAARKYGCRAVGYEVDPDLVQQSRENARQHGLDHLVRVEQSDLFKADLTDANVVAVYLPSDLLERLRPKLDQLKPGTKIVSHQFKISGASPALSLNPVSREDGDRHWIHVWTAPLPTQESRTTAAQPALPSPP